MNNKIIYGIIILCIVFTILIGASVLSTGYKIADFLLALFLSAIGLYLMYKNIETAKVAPDPNPNSSSGIVDNENLDNENIDKTLLEMLKVKINFDQIISEFILSLHNMKTLENKIYLKQYEEYKINLEKNLKNLNSTINSGNKEILTDLINNNIYITTINKYKDLDKNLNNINESDKNRNNINELYKHFINMYTNNDDPELEELKAGENLIDNLKKLQQVILSIENNASYIARFNYLIKFEFNNDEKLNGTGLKESAKGLIIPTKKVGQGELDAAIMQEFINNHNKCYQQIEQYLIGDTDEDKIKNYNTLIKNIKKDNGTKEYLTDIEKYININTPLDIFENWKKTCIITDNN
jgi:hypothetical protein